MSNVEVATFGAKRTPQQVLIDALNDAESYTDLVFVALDDKGDVVTGWAMGKVTTHLGLLAWAQQRIVAIQTRVEDGDEDPASA